MSHQTKNVALHNSNRSVVGTAQSRGAIRDRFQHRLNIRRRASNDPQDFAGRRLLLQCLLELLKQPYILKGDDRLVGKGFEELDLCRSEGAYFDTACVQRTNEFALLEKRSG